MENVYALIGYNTKSGQTLSDPIVKLLPLTVVADANAQFRATRSGQQASSGGGVHTSFTTTTVTHTPTRTVMIGGPPTSAPASGAKVAEALDVQGKASTDGNSDSDLNLPTGSLSDKLRHCLPAIILGAILVGLFLIGLAIWALVSRRRRSGARESAYRNIHHAETADHSRALYGHEDDNVRYSDPYSDKL